MLDKRRMTTRYFIPICLNRPFVEIDQLVNAQHYVIA